MRVFFLVAFKMCLLSLVFTRCITMPVAGDFFECNVLCSCCFSSLKAYVLCQLWGVSIIISSSFVFFCTAFFLLSFWDSYDTNVTSFSKLSHESPKLCLLKNNNSSSSFSCSSHEVVFIDRLLCSLTLTFCPINFAMEPIQWFLKIFPVTVFFVVVLKFAFDSSLYLPFLC